MGYGSEVPGGSQPGSRALRGSGKSKPFTEQGTGECDGEEKSTFIALAADTEGFRGTAFHFGQISKRSELSYP